MELYELQQKDIEKVDLYATKFQKLLNRVNTDNGFSNEDAIAVAKRIEAGSYYRQQPVEKINLQQQIGNELIDLKKTIQGLTVNYVALLAKMKDTRVHRPRDNSYTRRQFQNSYTWERKKEREYNKCGEPGHLARNCISEKRNYIYFKQNKEKEYNNKPKNISFCELEDKSKDEVYTVNNLTTSQTTKSKVQISNNGTEGLKPYEEDEVQSNSGNTFDEFDYEEEEFDEFNEKDKS
ncbi:26472_t:CDS:2 [Gigaspora margarita]|uniref:26472_t:CDS:1 n=1 Tax=Gigaspora margarita TaxID=4874 RepID=A0ABM8W4E1_GIGMA|nr:26472_t:CDS:2 [Gigaspora margarita]